ncbi:MAG: T9SS type A sorting domain-containing protein, partial [Saprospiraceae bacterium]|nr:T9SS type A sorting domain-containing protein [Saprospiraceae bacterium]
SADLNVKLYPNPSFNTSFLEINTPVGAKIEGHIFDASGKLIGGQLFDTVVDDGYFTYRLDAQSFAEGVYTIRLIIDGQVKSLRWIVIK